jgi:peroxiredoxin
MLAVGTRAPDARVAVRPREWVDLSSFMGEKPLVLLFFPMAFSSTCTSEMCAVAEDWSAWQQLGANVIGISVDSPYVNVKFAEETKAPFPIVSDFNRDASRAYDVLRADLGGLKDVSERVVYVIDRAGRIAYAWQGEHPGVFPPLDEVKDLVRRAG